MDSGGRNETERQREKGGQENGQWRAQCPTAQTRGDVYQLTGDVPSSPRQRQCPGGMLGFLPCPLLDQTASTSLCQL
ncbi:hypothetical protein ACOMHN_067306 [Nucella lapillus]